MGDKTNNRIRVGLHSGEVALRIVRHTEFVEYDAAGVSVHFAAHMEHSAAPPWYRLGHKGPQSPSGSRGTPSWLSCPAAPALAPIKAQLAERTQGIPLFVEEMIRTLSETEVLNGEPGRYGLAAAEVHLRVPDTVQSLGALGRYEWWAENLDIAERLAQELGDVRRLLAIRVARLHVLNTHGRIDHGIAACRQAEETARAHGDPHQTVAATYFLAQAHNWHGAFADGVAALDRAQPTLDLLPRDSFPLRASARHGDHRSPTQPTAQPCSR